jgi:hypothetical protein
LEPWRELLPGPVVHADLAAAAALAARHNAAYAEFGIGRGGPVSPQARVEVVLGDGDRLVDGQPRAPEQHDQRPQTGAVDTVAGLAHDRDDLLDRGRIGRVAQPLVARRAPGEKAGQGCRASDDGRRR